MKRDDGLLNKVRLLLKRIGAPTSGASGGCTSITSCDQEQFRMKSSVSIKS